MVVSRETWDSTTAQVVARRGTMRVDQILEHNEAFVHGRAARPLPPVEAIPLAVVACYDPRLDALLLPSLGLAPGEAFVRSAGALVRSSGGSLRSLALAVYLFGVTEVVVVGHTSCRMARFENATFIDAFRGRGVAREAFGAEDLREWAGAIASPATGVRLSMANIASAPFLPRDLAVSGFVLDDGTGALEAIARRAQPAAPAVVEPAPTEAGAQPAASAARHPPAREPAAAPEGRLGEAIRHFTLTVQSKTHLREELERLRSELERPGNPLLKLQLVEAFARRAGAESSEVIHSFQRLKEVLAAAPHLGAEHVIRLLRRATAHS